MKEQHTLSDHTVAVVRKSRLLPGLTYTAGYRFICPRCKLGYREPEHGSSWACLCGLKFEAWGNSLTITGRWLWK